MEKIMAHTSQSPDARALQLIRQAANEYNNSEYKFYPNGYFKYSRDGKHTLLIEDIYVEPALRGGPISKILMETFYKFMKDNKILVYYGRVFKGSPNYQKRIDTFIRWGMRIGTETDYYTVVLGDVT